MLPLGSCEQNNPTKRQVTELFSVSDSTIKRYLASHEDELKRNGYFLLRGKNLKFNDLVDATLINEGSKVTVLGLFTFPAALNLAMLLTESEKAVRLCTVAHESAGV
jgi:hypothetical protein